MIASRLNLGIDTLKRVDFFTERAVRCVSETLVPPGESDTTQSNVNIMNLAKVKSIVTIRGGLFLSRKIQESI